MVDIFWGWKGDEILYVSFELTGKLSSLIFITFPSTFLLLLFFFLSVSLHLSTIVKIMANIDSPFDRFAPPRQFSPGPLLVKFYARFESVYPLLYRRLL